MVSELESMQQRDQNKLVNQVKMVHQFDTEPPHRFRNGSKSEENPEQLATPNIVARSSLKSPTPSSDLSTLTSSFHSAGPQIEPSPKHTTNKLHPNRATVARYYRHSSSSIDHKSLNLNRYAFCPPSPKGLVISNDQYIALNPQDNINRLQANRSNSTNSRDPNCRCLVVGQAQSSFRNRQAQQAQLQNRTRASSVGLQKYLTQPVPPPRLPNLERGLTIEPQSPLSFLDANDPKNCTYNPTNDNVDTPMSGDANKRQLSVARSLADGSLDNIQMIVDEEISACSSFTGPNPLRNDDRYNHFLSNSDRVSKNLEPDFNDATLRRANKSGPNTTGATNLVAAPAEYQANIKSRDSTIIKIPSKFRTNMKTKQGATNTTTTGTPSTSTGDNGFLSGVEHVVHFNDLDQIIGQDNTNSSSNQAEAHIDSRRSRALGDAPSGGPASSDRHQFTQTANPNVGLIYDRSGK